MSIEITGTVQSVRLLWDFVKANKTLANYNELVAAVSEVNAGLLSAQDMALTSQKSELALTQRIRELEKKIAELEDWNREAERYELYAAPLGMFTYRLKPGMEQGETRHYLCTNCFTDSKKSVLQFSVGEHSAKKSCPRCKDQVWISVEDFVRFFPVGSR